MNILFWNAVLVAISAASAMVIKDIQPHICPPITLQAGGQASAL
jgi:hypothetical protein